MQLYINQKYFTIGNRFAITDANGKPFFYAEGQLLKLTSECDLYDLSGMPIYKIKARLMHFFTHFEIMVNDNVVGEFDGKIHWPFVHRTKLSLSDKYKVLIRSGVFHAKAYIADENWKIDKEPAAVVSKKVMQIGDTYCIDFDEKKIPPALAATIGLWYEFKHHNKKH